MEELALEPERLNYKFLAKQFSVRHFPLGLDEKQLDVCTEKPLEKLTLVNTSPRPSQNWFLVILVSAPLSPPHSLFPWHSTPYHPLKHNCLLSLWHLSWSESILFVYYLFYHQNISIMKQKSCLAFHCSVPVPGMVLTRSALQIFIEWIGCEWITTGLFYF